MNSNFRKEIDSINAEIVKLRDFRMKAIEHEQRNCPHEIIFEASAQEYEYLNRDHEYRVCAHCGYAEESHWGGGYEALRSSRLPIGKISRAEASKYVLKRYRYNEAPTWARLEKVKK